MADTLSAKNQAPDSVDLLCRPLLGRWADGTLCQWTAGASSAGKGPWLAGLL